MRVTVVGATGHIGTYLVPRLVARGHHVVVVSRGQRRPYVEGPAWESVEVFHADRVAEERDGTFGATVASTRPDAVVDLTCFEVRSAQSLVEALAPQGTFLLHCGTIWVHGTAVEVPVTEDAPRRPFGDYGTKKAAIEEYLLAVAGRGDLPCTVLHPGHIVGPGWHPLGPAGNFNVDVFGRLARGEPLDLPNFGLETVHHVHADDVAQGFELALEAPVAASGQSFHVVSDRALTLRGYAESVAAWFGQTARLSYRPYTEWAPGWSKEDAEATWEHIARSPSMSTEKIAGTLGYRPGYTSLDSVHQALTWLVEHGEVDPGGRTMVAAPGDRATADGQGGVTGTRVA